MAALVLAVRRLGYRLGTSTGLFEPTAAQTNAWIRAGQEAIKIDPKDVDERALKVFWGLRQSEHDPGVSQAQVTQILKAVCELRKEYGITSK